MALTISDVMQEGASSKVLLLDEDVKRWHDGLRKYVGKGYLHRLHGYCKFRQKTPAEIVEEFTSNKKIAQDRIEDYLLALKKSNKAPKTLAYTLAALKSFLKRFELEVTRKIKIENKGSTPTLRGETPPSLQDVEKILQYANVRERAMVSIIAYAGIRFESAAGLMLYDFPELEIKDRTAKVLKNPMRINVRSENSKNEDPYFAFLAHPEYLQAYLTQRLADEELKQDSPIFVVARTMRSHDRIIKKGDPLTAGAISMEIRTAMRLAGFTQRPYSLKSTFATALLNGRLDPEVQYFLTGHAGTIQGTYTTRKNLADEMVSKMRADFAEVFAPPETVSREQVAMTAKLESRKELLLAAGYSPEEIQKFGDLMKLTPQRVGELYQLKLHGMQDDDSMLGLTPKELNILSSPDMRNPLSKEELDALYSNKKIEAPKKETNPNKFEVLEVAKSDRERIIELVSDGFEPVQGSDFNGSMLYRRRRNEQVKRGEAD